jgi:lysophospholipid acyltransferase (LPLAT)-like uncharacterized protein
MDLFRTSIAAISVRLKYQIFRHPDLKAFDFLIKQNHLLSVFHGKTFHNFYLYRNRGTVIWTDQSWRGKILNRACTRLGFNAVFISRKNQKRGFVDYLRKLREGGEGVVAVDGPLGPRQTVYPGILQLAASSGFPIHPVGTFYTRKIILPWRWDRYEIPLPYSKVIYVIGEPLVITKADIDSEDKLKRQCQNLQNKMLQCQDQAMFLARRRS